MSNGQDILENIVSWVPSANRRFGGIRQLFGSFLDPKQCISNAKLLSFPGIHLPIMPAVELQSLANQDYGEIRFGKLLPVGMLQELLELRRLVLDPPAHPRPAHDGTSPRIRRHSLSAISG